VEKFEFTYIASTSDLEDPNLEDRFFEAGCDDATIMVTKGLIAACFVREAENYIHAICTAMRDVASAGVTVERFEPDFLVTQSEIAVRSGMSRQAISLYVKGARGDSSDPFPNPYALVTSPAPLWDWVDVSSWLHKAGKVGHDVPVKAELGRTVNKFLVGRSKPSDAQANFVRQLEAC